jgi:cytochrome bd-type quinol oxidase subunit 2
MAALQNKIQNSLDESRMLILGAQILTGFAFSSTFQPGFATLTRASQNLNFVALTLILTTICLLISPVSFHQLTTKGEDTWALHSFTTHVMESALLPFALGVGAGVYVPAEVIAGKPVAVSVAASITFVALAFWYGPTLLRPKTNARGKGKKMDATDHVRREGSTSVHDKIRHVLTEARVILPGNQALLGFQFAVTLQQGFRELPGSLRLVHLISLCLTALSTILLLSPAAYHRIVEEGEETERFYRVANRFVLSSLPPMAVGICTDFLVVVYRMFEQWSLSIIASLLIFSVFSGMWFVYPLLRKNRANEIAGAMA